MFSIFVHQDGHFAPNITFGPPIIKSLRPHSGLFFDCHCMVSDPKKWVQSLKKAGADQINFHIEATGAGMYLYVTICIFLSICL